MLTALGAGHLHSERPLAQFDDAEGLS